MNGIAMALALLLAASAPPDPAAVLREADAAMSRAVSAHDPAAFARFVDEEAIWGGPASLQEGRSAVTAWWARYTSPGGERLTWSPRQAVLAASGDLGYTLGDYRWEGKGPGGKALAAEGRYLTVWRRGKDGAFRAVFDMELEPARPGPAVARTTRRRLASRAGDLQAEVGTWTTPDGARGSFLSVLRRGEGGVLEPAAETLQPFAR